MTQGVEAQGPYRTTFATIPFPQKALFDACRVKELDEEIRKPMLPLDRFDCQGGEDIGPWIFRGFTLGQPVNEVRVQSDHCPAIG